jgi:hypothetical protein
MSVEGMKRRGLESSRLESWYGVINLTNAGYAI